MLTKICHRCHTEKPLEQFHKNKGKRLGVQSHCKSCRHEAVLLIDRRHWLPTEQRFWGKVDKRGEDECWPWKGFISPDGYARITIAKKMILAHRAAFFFFYGRWPEPCGMHTCDFRACCNPHHIVEGTHQENMADMATKGRQRGPRGGGCPWAYVTNEQAGQIRVMYATGCYTQVALAEIFGKIIGSHLPTPVIWRIVHDKCYRDAISPHHLPESLVAYPGLRGEDDLGNP